MLVMTVHVADIWCSVNSEYHVANHMPFLTSWIYLVTVQFPTFNA